ncbi:MAG: PAS domain S-box protein [Prolixibacteraceae bacterium]
MTNIANLLIVDDSPANLVYLEAVIRDPGINLIQALSGYEALEKTAGVDLALAIIDVRMPEMDGIELATKINKQSKHKVPVIFLTASYLIEEEILSGYNSGAVDFISKPISKHVLNCKINVFLDLFIQKQIVIRDAEKLKETTYELLKTNLALQKSERRLYDITFSMAEWVWEVNKEGVYTHSSTRGADLLGVTMNEIIGKRPFDFMAPEEVDNAIAYFSEVIKNRDGIKDFENWNIRGNGERICLLTNGVPFFDDDGNLEGYRGVDKDITERKLAETILKESEKKYRSYIDNAPDGVFVTDETGRYLDVNQSASTITGFSTEELLTMSISDILPEENLEEGLQHFKKVVEQGISSDELPFKHKDGRKRWWAISAVQLSPSRFLGFTKDITLRRNLQEKLLETSGRLSLAIKASGIGVWDLDLVCDELLWDERMYELYGSIKGISKLSFNSWQDAIHPDDQKQTSIEFQLALEGKKEFDTEYRICWKDGSVHYIRANALVIRNEEGKPKRIIGTNWDITKQKILEERLKSSETNFRTFFETMDDFVVVGNMQGKIIYANDVLSHKLGYTAPELLQMEVLELNPPEERDEAEQIFSDMLTGKRNNCPLPLVRKDGTKIPVETRVWLGKWNGGDCIFGLCKDMTAEQLALRKFNKIFESNPSLMAISTIPDGIFTDVNNAFLLKTGYTKEDILGKTSKELNLFVDQQKQESASYELEKSGFISNLELQIKVKSGAILEGLFFGEIIEHHNTKLFLTVMVDMTERKHAEDLIRESESSLAEAQRMAHIGSWEWNMITNKVQWSKEMFRVFDIAPETYDGSPESIIKVLHPDDVEIFTNSMNRNLSDGDDPSLEYRIIHRDGSIRYLKAEGRMEQDESGQTVKAIGTVQDITDSKRAQKELHQANNFLDSIVENIPNMVFIKDAKNLNFVRFNKAGENLTGITKDEIIGKNDCDFFPREQAEGFIEHDLLTLNNKIMIDISQESIQTRYQGVRILHTKKVPILGDNGNSEYLLGVSEDISERILAEYNLKLSEEKYRTMLNASPDGIFLLDLNEIITDVSDIGIELFGFDSKTELIGKIFSEFIDTEDKNTYSEIIEKTLNEGIAQNIEVRIRKKNQKPFLSEVSSTFIQGVDGKHFSFMMTIRDISQRKKTEAKQIHADRMANLGEMATGMAHEINQPLNIISMVLDKILFETEKTDSINIEFLKNKSDKIFENISRIRNIIDHVRSFSRSQDAYLSIAFDINSTIENALTMISEQFKYFGINLRLQLQKDIPQILGNTYNFEQVIINLLTNAKDAVLERKSRQKEYEEMIIDIKTFQINQSLVVEIIDNGIGIENTDFTNIMLPFYTTKEEGKGTGLGLSICYQIIKEMGGTIDISSERYEGTKVKLMLDIRKSH